MSWHAILPASQAYSEETPAAPRRRRPLLDIVWLFLATRLLLIIVTYVGYILFTAPKYSSTPVDVPALFTSWNHWDALRYLQIAQYGYQNKFDYAFSPLFPLLITAIAHVLGAWSYLAVGMVLSNAALLAALFVLYQLAVEYGGEQVARRTVLYLCIFPSALFFFAAYNEALFLLLSAGLFLALRRQRWWLAGLLGCLAALTRTTGLLLVLPYLYELWLARASITSSRRRLLTSLLPILLIPLGTALYCLYCWQQTGNPFIFATVQDHWGRHFSWPGQGLWLAFYELFWNQPFGSFYQVHILLDLSATLGFIALAILGWRTLRPSYTFWLAVLLVWTLLSSSIGQPDPLISNQRFVLEMFPGFITLAILGIRHPRLHTALLLLFPTLLAIMSLIFVMNRWMV